MSGATAWSSAGAAAISITRKEITSVTSATVYDVGFRYVVNGTPGAIQVCSGSPVTVGTLLTTGGGSAAGTILIADSSPGSHTVTLPAGVYGHVDISLTGPGGDGVVVPYGGQWGVVGYIYFGGGGGENRLVTGIAVTPGTTTITYFISNTVGTASTVSATGPFAAMLAHSGVSATASAGPGGGGAGGSGGAGTNGNAGGLTDAWDGGSAGNGGGDQTTNGAGGTTPGGGGAGAAYDSATGAFVAGPHAAGQIIVTARA